MNTLTSRHTGDMAHVAAWQTVWVTVALIIFGGICFWIVIQ